MHKLEQIRGNCRNILNVLGEIIQQLDQIIHKLEQIRGSCRNILNVLGEQNRTVKPDYAQVRTD